MYPISNDVLALFEAEQPKVLRITGTDKNGTAITITDNDVVADSFQLDRYACNGEKLEVGTAVAAQMTLKLFNGNGQFDDIVFEGTELNVEIGIADWSQASPVVTYVPCGLFTPDIQPRRMATISLTCLDRMTKFDVAVDATALTFPATVAGLVGQVCTVCGVTLAQSIATLPNADVSISALPSVNGIITYRNIIQWCAGIMATNAWMDWNGQLRFSWYNNSTSYVSTTDNRYSSDLYENDLTVTGVVYTNDSGIEIVEGTDDYALDLTGNALAGPLIATVLPAINTAVNGFAYRPFTAAVINAPYLWPMDSVVFTDKDGNDHASVLTNVAFGVNGTTALESKGMTEAINKLQAPVGVTKEQAQLISQAMEQVETDIDDSLTQQEIFNRLTDNGAAQGLVLLNGQLYVNATYLRGGTIDGDNVNAKLLNIVDADGNVIASFDNIITLGQTTEAHAELDYNSFSIYDKNSHAFFEAGDLRDINGYADTKEQKYGNGTRTVFSTSYAIYSVISIKIDGVATTDYTHSVYEITFGTAPADGSSIVITYRTQSAIYHIDFGRNYVSDIGGYSVAAGSGVTASGHGSHAEGARTTASGDYSHAENYNTTASGVGGHAEGMQTTASGDYSHAEGMQTTASGKYSHAEGRDTIASHNDSHAEGSYTIASGDCSHAEGIGSAASGSFSHAEGTRTIANGFSQHAFGKYNIEDNANTYVEIVGNGTSASARSNARTLDWNGNEWIAGALSVGDPATTRANLGITPANIGAVQNINIVNADIANAAALNAKLSQIPYSVSPSLRGAAIAYVPQQVMREITGITTANGGFGYIVRNGTSSFMFNVTSINGNVIYVFALTSTESDYSHGTVYQYTGTAV